MVSRINALEKKTNAIALKGESKTQVIPPTKNNDEELKRLTERLN